MSSDTPAAPKEASPALENDFASRLTFPDKKDGDAPSEEKGSELADAQTDGPFNAPGGHLMAEPEHDVHVTLANMQEDPNNPLYSVKSFNELNLYVYDESAYARYFIVQSHPSSN